VRLFGYLHSHLSRLSMVAMCAHHYILYIQNSGASPTRSQHLLRLCMRIVYINDLLHLVITPHEDARSIVYMLRHDRQHALHPAVDCLSARCSPGTRRQSVTLSLIRSKRTGKEHVPFSNTNAIGAHSYKIRNLPFGLFLSAGYAKMPPYNNVRYASATIDPIYRALYGFPSLPVLGSLLGYLRLLKYSFTGSSQYRLLPSLTE